MTQFKWRCSLLKWDSGSWAKFCNKDDSARKFYAEVSPVGTRWEARLILGVHIESARTMGDSPIDALENALTSISETVNEIKRLA